MQIVAFITVVIFFPLIALATCKDLDRKYPNVGYVPDWLGWTVLLLTIIGIVIWRRMPTRWEREWNAEYRAEKDQQREEERRIAKEIAEQKWVQNLELARLYKEWEDGWTRKWDEAARTNPLKLFEPARRGDPKGGPNFTTPGLGEKYLRFSDGRHSE